MPSLFHAAVVAVALLFMGGCCRDTIREMASLKDVGEHPKQRSAKAPAKETSKSAQVEREDDDDDKASKIETGSINKPNCQGAHLAYQATKEYLKNFGPKPPDEPGERGACNPKGQ
jgi:hypothetical protein